MGNYPVRFGGRERRILKKVRPSRPNAELGACFLAADLGFEPVPETHHAAYLQSWLQVLKNDKRFIFQAASQAQKAVDFIHRLQGPSG